MKRYTMIGLLAASLVGAAVASIAPRSLEAQTPKATDKGAVGQYQVVLGGGSPAPCVVIDTTTGQCWLKGATGWDDLGAPVGPKK